jgi:single-stranded-DNA-specific exonuclease
MPSWVGREAPHELEKQLQQAGSFPKAIARLLALRGILPSQLFDFLDPSLDSLQSPFSIVDMAKAVDRLFLAFQKGEKVCVYADFDLDGTSGLALLRQGLMQLGFENVSFYQPRRLKQGYGFHQEAVEESKSAGVSLMVTVDVGISAVDTVAYANSLGVDVIITDHHLPGCELPAAFAVVNPNRAECTSKLQYLSGAGVAFYLLRALKRKFFDQNIASQARLNLRELLDLFAIATIADMVPLVGDNRVLVQLGLGVLEETQRPGLKQLLKKLELSHRKILAFDVGMKIAPKLNAMSRMDNDFLPLDVFLSDEASADALVSKAFSENDLRVQLQQQGEAKARILAQEMKFKDFVAVASKEFHKGVIGLIASRLMEEEQQPCFVGCISDEGIITGSARSSSVSLVEVLQENAQVLTRFGGHAFAAGFELPMQSWDSFVNGLDLVFEKRNKIEVKSEYDLELRLSEIDKDFLYWFEKLEPFGKGFANPLIRLKGFSVRKAKILKQKHLKLDLAEQGQSLQAILFSAHSDVLSRVSDSMEIDFLLGELQWNHFNNRRQLQMIVKGMGVGN